MFCRIPSSLIVLLGVAASLVASSPRPATRPEVAFVLVGDSTTANSSTVNSGGWGNGFSASLKPGVAITNRASNGKTTGTIVTSGQWALAVADIKSEVKKGKLVFVTMAFGHNDQKIAGPESMGQNLTNFVHEIRRLGAHPVLITALSRRSFVGNTTTINDALGPWADETISVATKLDTILLDVHAASIAYLQHIGREASWLLNRSPADFTHLNVAATNLFGRMVADLFQIFGQNHPSLPKFDSPFINDADRSLALYTGKQCVYTPIYPPNNGTVPSTSSLVPSASASAVISSAAASASASSA